MTKMCGPEGTPHKACDVNARHAGRRRCLSGGFPEHHNAAFDRFARHAPRGPRLLSLALIDARNHTLHLLSLYEEALGPDCSVTRTEDEGVVPPVWLAGHIGWFAEWWIGRNTQRAFGNDCPVRPTRLAAIDPGADDWWNPAQPPRGAALVARPARPRPDQGLPARNAGEHARAARARGRDRPGPVLLPPRAVPRRPARRAVRGDGADAGAAPGHRADAYGRHARAAAAARHALGAGPARQRLRLRAGAAAHRVDVPEFEIDAQPVTWNQYIEFVDDGGYDREELWHREGWRWLAAQVDGRRGPRHVEQIGVARNGTGGSVLQQRFGATVRAAGHHSAVHLSWWEADAWARWAGRRIATEVEWEIAAHTAARRGFRWADVHEWTAGTLQPWPGLPRRPVERGRRVRSRGRLRPGARAARCLVRDASAAAFAAPTGLCTARPRRRLLRFQNLRAVTRPQVCANRRCRCCLCPTTAAAPLPPAACAPHRPHSAGPAAPRR
jgi:iron(II)-dependent oxidoreductase